MNNLFWLFYIDSPDYAVDRNLTLDVFGDLLPADSPLRKTVLISSAPTDKRCARTHDWCIDGFLQSIAPEMNAKEIVNQYKYRSEFLK